MPIPFDDPAGKTGQVQQAIIRYLKKRPAPVLVMENVAKIEATRKADQGKKVPVQQQHDVLRKFGYQGSWLKLNSKEFALAQSRPRTYMVYFHAGCGSATASLKTILTFRAQPKPLSHYIGRDVGKDEGGRSSSSRRKLSI
jgi:site-specific DNA-cytosine methylase